MAGIRDQQGNLDGRIRVLRYPDGGIWDSGKNPNGNDSGLRESDGWQELSWEIHSANFIGILRSRLLEFGIQYFYLEYILYS